MRNFTRQSFLGPNSEEIFQNTTIGLIGYSGGGSHFGEQFSRIGIGNFVVIDPKPIEEKHLHRLIGSSIKDVQNNITKVEIAKRQIKIGNPLAKVLALNNSWKNSMEYLLDCDLIFGSVDSFVDRGELEEFCRRNLIPYIDIGMSVIKTKTDYLISGQVIQSMPGGICMKCCDFISDRNLQREALEYGNAGDAPQVIWANGILASTAVSWGIELISPWYIEKKLFRYICYDGNTGELTHHPIMNENYSTMNCKHYPLTEIGDPLVDIRIKNQSITNTKKKYYSKYIEKIKNFFGSH